MADLVPLAVADAAGQHGEDGSRSLLDAHRAPRLDLAPDAAEEGLAVKLIRLTAGSVALEEEAAHEERQLCGEVAGLVGREAVAEGREGAAEGVVGDASVRMAELIRNVSEEDIGFVDGVLEAGVRSGSHG